MRISEGMLAELRFEAATTRTMLERVRQEHFGWRPHARSNGPTADEA